MDKLQPNKSETLKDFVARNKENYSINELKKIYFNSLRQKKSTTEIIKK